MLLYAAIPLTCWVCALIAIPRRPRTGDEVQELVYSRLLGRQQRLVLLAFAVTGLALFASVFDVSHRVHGDLGSPPRVAINSVQMPTRCDWMPLGAGVAEEVHDDGTNVVYESIPIPSGCRGT